MVTDRRHLALFLSGLSGGGAQRRMLALARAFAARGHRVDVVVPRSRGPFAAQLSPAVRLVSLDPVAGRLPGVGSRRPLLVLAAVPALARYLRRERPDVVLSTSNAANLACVCARALAGGETPVVLAANVHLSAAIARRSRAVRPLLRWLARRTYARADAVIAISSGVAEDLPRAAGVPRERVHAIHNPVYVDEIRERSRARLDHPWLAPGEPPVVLAVGKLAPQKDHPTLLRAFARVRAARPARLVILGEGAGRRRLARLARRLGVASDVALPGFEPNPHAWMARASVFALSSAWEGFSNALAEALACGCPVVSTDCPSGPAEVLDGGAFGALCPVGDDRALAAAILAALDAPRSPDRLRARAATFSVDAAAERYLDVLLAAGCAARSPAAGRRLCLLVRSLHGGGMERMVLALAGAFAERGHRVSLLVAVPSGAMRARVPSSVELVPLAKSPPLVGRAWAIAADRGAFREMLPLLAGPAPRMLSRLPALVRYLREARPDALLAAGTQSNLAALWARRFRGVTTRVVVSERNTMSVVARRGRHGFRRAYPRLARRAYPRADAIVAVSDGVAGDLSRVAGIARERIVRIENPVVSPALLEKARASPGHSWMAPGGPPVVLAAGRLHRQKDFPTLLRAFARVRARRAARLVILGEGAERRGLERLARALGVEADVALPGFVENPYAWMARAAVFVLSSAWEGIGNVLVEAMACGCPVVATDCPSGPAEILEQGALGPLVPVGDPAALAEAILGQLARPPDRERLRARAARFSVDAAADRYLEVLLAEPAVPEERAAAARALASHG